MFQKTLNFVKVLWQPQNSQYAYLLHAPPQKRQRTLIYHPAIWFTSLRFKTYFIVLTGRESPRLKQDPGIVFVRMLKIYPCNCTSISVSKEPS
jgi:hypothetical protein